MKSSREMTSAVYMALVRNTGTVSLVLESNMLKTKLKNWKEATRLFRSLEKCLEMNDFENLTCLAHQIKARNYNVQHLQEEEKLGIRKDLPLGEKRI